MNPKISNFGLAKTFGSDQSWGNTNRVVGTYGYMSPEYAVDGIFSMKSDVFSFGVILLEMLSRKKNRGFSYPDHHLNLLGYAWILWIEDKALELINKTLRDSCTISEVLRCLHVALLCVQRVPEDRPSMSSVVLILSSDVTLPPPKQPGFYTERSVPESPLSTCRCSANTSITIIEARISGSSIHKVEDEVHFVHHDNQAFDVYSEIEFPIAAKKNYGNSHLRVTHGGYDASIGFGFDATTNDYKVVRVVTLLDEDETPTLAEEVFSKIPMPKIIQWNFKLGFQVGKIYCFVHDAQQS
ncbi:unnamed protein product [Prunus brigantina]